MPGDIFSRRQCLKAIAGAGIIAAMPDTFARAEDRSDAAAVTRYLESLARPDGGYGWAGQDTSHLTPSFAVLGCYRLLKQTPPRRAALAEYIRAHHPFQIKRLERNLQVFDYQQIQSLLWLGEDVKSFRETIAGWTQPSDYPTYYEQHGYPVFQMEVMALLCRELLGLPPGELAPAFTDYVESRRRPNGSFNQTQAADGGDGHVMNTWWGLLALRALHRPVEKRPDTVQWLQACQRAGGGFTYRPQPEVAAVEDVAYTWAAVRALTLLGAAPTDRAGCLRHLQSLRNDDGGFGNRPGWASNPMATYCALDALDALHAVDEAFAGAKPEARSPRPAPSLPPDLKVFSVQIEAPGQGSPSDAVELARALRIHLWGAKNTKPGWIEQAQALANRRKVPVTFFVANEEYGTYVSLPGLGTYSHTSDLMAPAGVDFGPPLPKERAATWQEFRDRRLAPLRQAGGFLFWQFGENEEFTRILLDDSLERGGFAAISTFHFGNPDFTNSEPFLYQYYGRIPFVALQDAHGTEPLWWGDRLAGFRTVFLGTEPTWAAWRRALQNNWVASFRHDVVTQYRTRRHGGAPGVLEYVLAREGEWRWWGEKPDDIRRPAAMIAVVGPEDTFEAGRPERGVSIRVRCWWETTNQALPRQQVVELVRLTLDGEPIEPTLQEKKNAQEKIVDLYHLYPWPDPKPGKHTVTAVVRHIATGTESTQTLEFTL